jgi:hypothetical protein
VQAANLSSTRRHGTAAFDVVLVDGRWRVACALELLTSSLLSPRGVVLLHDFSTRAVHGREYRRTLLRYFQVVRIARSLAVLRPRRAFAATAPNTSRDDDTDERGSARAQRPFGPPRQQNAPSRKELLEDWQRALESAN